MMNLLTDLELRAVLDALDTRIEHLAEKVSGRSLSLKAPAAINLLEYKDRLIVLTRAREKIMLGSL